MPSATARLTIRGRPLPDGSMSVRVIGVVDQGTAEGLQRRLIEEARRCAVQPPHLLVDLSMVTFLDYVGLNALLEVQTRLSNGSGTLDLVDAGPAIIRLLHEAHLDGASGMPPDDHPNP